LINDLKQPNSMKNLTPYFFILLMIKCFFTCSLSYGQGVPPRYITINGITQDLLADRTWTITNIDTNAVSIAGLADSVHGRVKYLDSLAIFATPKNVKDSANSLRAAIPDAYSKTVSDARYLLTADTAGGGNRITYTQWDLNTAGHAVVALGNISPLPSTGTVISVATNSTLTGGPIVTTGTLGLNLANANLWANTIGWATGLGGSMYHLLGPADTTFSISSPLKATGGGSNINISTPDATGLLNAAGNFNVTTGQSQGAAVGGNINFTANRNTNSGAGGGVITITSNGQLGGNGLLLTSNTGNVLIKTAGTNAAGGDIVSRTINVGNAGGAGGVAAGSILDTTGSGGNGTNTTTGAGGAGGLHLILLGGGGNASGSNGGLNGGDGGQCLTIGGKGGNATAVGTHTGGRGSSFSWLTGGGGNATGASGTRTGGNAGSYMFNTGAPGTGATANGLDGYYSFKINGAWIDTMTSAGVYVAVKTYQYNDMIFGPASGLDFSTGGGAALAGTATLAAGTATVNTTSVKAGDLIMISGNTAGGSGSSYYAPTASITAGTSFVINAVTPGTTSVNTSDVSTVNWVIVHTH
jgi:hypothetical protein